MTRIWGTAGAERPHMRRGALAVAATAAVLAGLVAGPGVARAVAASPRLELISNYGPTNVPITASVPQEFTIHGEYSPLDGRFRIEVEIEGVEKLTKPIRGIATAAQVQEALEKLPDVGAHNVVVTGGPTGDKPQVWSYSVSFVGALDGVNAESFEVFEESPTAHETKEAEAAEKEAIEKGEEVEPESYEEEPSFSEEEVAVGNRDEVKYELIPINRGGAATSGKLTVTDELPAGLVTAEQSPKTESWSCTEGSGLTTITCTNTTSIPADGLGNPIGITAYANPENLTEGALLTNTAEISGGGSPADAAEPNNALVSNTPAAFGVHEFKAADYDANGAQDTVAGGHPYQATTTFFFNTRDRYHVNPLLEPELATSGIVKDIDTQVPEGFLGDTVGRPRCTQAQFAGLLTGGTGQIEGKAFACPAATQVGVLHLFTKQIGDGDQELAVWNLVPPKGDTGVPAEFGSVFAGVPIRFDAHVQKTNGHYVVAVLSPDINEVLNIDGVSLTLWGTPAEESHNAERRAEEGDKPPAKMEDPEEEKLKRPFLSNPTSCVAEAEEAPETVMYFDQWVHPSREVEGEPELASWQRAESASPAVTGCEALKFEPSTRFEPRPSSEGGSDAVAAPSGYEFELHVPQHEAAGELVAPELKDTTVTLPPGVVLSAAAANGLEACSPGQIDLESTKPGACPAASRVGEVLIETALLEEPLKGSVFIAEPECSPCSAADDREGKLFKLYIEAEAPGARVNVKLAGRTETGTLETEKAEGLKVGQIRTTFLNNPQTPFTTLKLNLKGGPDATLANPALCGSYTGESVFTPWSVKGELAGGVVIPGDEPAVLHPSFAIEPSLLGGECPEALGFSPQMSAGTESSQAGAYSDLVTVFKRPSDGEQDLKGITVKTPQGLLGKVAGVEKCAVSPQALEAETASCPAGSLIGKSLTEAGSGTKPYTVEGKVYLTGETSSAVTGKHGPFGLDIVVPAKAGPFNLGTVVVQAVIETNELTGALTVTSNPLPQSIDGVPFRIKEVEVKMDRPEFTFNATHCTQEPISALVSGEPAGVKGEESLSSSLETPYAATGCEHLAFNPTFTASVNSHASILDGTTFSVKVEQRHGEAAIHKVELQLPEDLPSRQETLKLACTTEKFEAAPEGADCPPQSFVGTAIAHTPLLNAPLTGRGVLEAHGAKFPDLVFLLHGEGVHILLRGKTNIINGVTYSYFETVPDAPITSFETSFPAGRYSLIGVPREIALCEHELVAPTKLVGQNNAVIKETTKIKVEGCPPSIKGVLDGTHAGKLRLLIHAGQAGTVHISGKSVKAMTKRGLRAGTHQLLVTLSKSGRTALRHEHDLEVKITLTAAGHTGTTTIKSDA